MFIPYNTERPNKRLAYVTALLVAANVFVFVYQFFFTDPQQFILRYGFTPAHGNWYSPFSSMFLHGGFMHLAGNMLYLYVFGNDVEDALGHYVFLAFYLLGGLGATALHTAVLSVANPAGLQVPAVGASGAISAVMGLYAVRFYKTNVLIWYLFYYRAGTTKVKAAWFIGFYFIMQVLLGAVTLSRPVAVGYWAHIGGALTGLFAALFIASPKEAKVEYAGEAAEAAEVAGANGVAIYHWEEVLKADPTNAGAHLRVAQAYARRREDEKASKHLAIASGLPRPEEGEDALAAAYALVLGLGCQVSLPAEVLFRLACACEDAGQAADADKAWATLAETYPQHPNAETALIRLARLREQTLADLAGAAEAYERYVKAYPQGQWRDLAQSGLRRAREKV